MPWQWDYDNYYGKDMEGYFYPEDINTILEIMRMETKREQAAAKRNKK